MRRLLLTLALLLGAATGYAQVLVPSPQAVAAASTNSDCTSTARSCASWTALSNYPSLTMQITGTFSGTLTFEATSDGQTWFAIQATKLGTGVAATTTTGTGQFSITNPGVTGFRARATSWSSGGANCTLTRGTASARGIGGGGAGSPGGTSGSIQYNNGGLFGGFGNWDGSVLTDPGTLLLTNQDTPGTDHDVLLSATAFGGDAHWIEFLRGNNTAVTQLVMGSSFAATTRNDSAVAAVVTDATTLKFYSSFSGGTTTGGFSSPGTSIVRTTNGSTGYSEMQAQDFRLVPNGVSKPTCDASVRGTLWYTSSGAGVADAMEVCAKASTDVYAWRSMATIP